MTCKKCKKLCILCEHHYETNDMFQHKCKVYRRTNTNCVTGKEETRDGICLDLNKNGDCTKFKLDKRKDLRERIIKLIEEYEFPRDEYGFYCSAYHANVQKTLARNYIECLRNKGKCDAFDISFDKDDEYGDVIYKKDPRLDDKVHKKPKKKRWWQI